MTSVLWPDSALWDKQQALSSHAASTKDKANRGGLALLVSGCFFKSTLFLIRPSENPRATENSHDGCQKQKYVRHEAQSNVPLFDTPSPMVLP